MRLILLFISFVFSIGLAAHPLHMSVTNISILDGDVEITVKAFGKDIAYELNALHHLDENAEYYYLNKQNDSLLIKHFIRNFDLVLNSVTIIPNNIKVELIEGEFVFSFERKFAEKCSKCMVSNTLLLQTYHDQKNLIIINNQNVEKGFELNVDKPKGEIEF